MSYRTHSRTLGTFVIPYVPDADINGGLGIRYVGPGAVASVPIQLPPWKPYVDGDLVELLWDGNQLARRTMAASDSDKTLQFDIDPNDIRQYEDGEHALKARLTLVVSGDTNESDPVPVWVKTTPPGGIDPEPDTTTINEKLATPTVRPDPPTNDLDNVRVAFPMYENAAVGDKLTVSWQGRFIPVPPAQPVPLTEADLAKTEFEIAIPRSVIEDAGGGADVPISYRIIDRVNNSSLWAPYLRQRVPIEDPNAPPAPWVEDTVDDDGLVLRLIDLDNGPVSVMVEAGHGGKKGETVHVHWAGTAADARPVPAYDTAVQTLSRDNATLFFDIPYEQARLLGEGSVEVTYVVHHANGTTTTSRRRTLTIEGQAIGLLPPFVINTPNNVLDAAQHKSGALMVAPLQPDLVPAGSLVTFTWAGVDPGSTESFANEGSDTYGMMPYASIQAMVGTTVRIKYQVNDFIDATDGDVAPADIGLLRISESDWITLNVIDSDAATPDLPPPFVPEAINDILDPATLLAHLSIPKPTPARATQIAARIDAKVPFSQTLVIRDPANPPTFQLLGTTFIQPNDGSKAIATYTLTGADGYVAQSGPYAFTIGQVSPALPPPTVDQADGTNLDPVKAKDGVTVRIPADLQAGDSVVVHLGNWTSAAYAWSPNLGVPVPGGEVARWLGKGVDVTYTVNGSIDSPPLTLNVLDFSDGDGRLPTPAIAEASRDVLDLGTFEGPALGYAPSWPLMAEGQYLWLRITWPGGEIPVLTAHRITAAEVGKTIEADIARDQLERMAANTAFTITAYVTYDGSASFASARRFPPKNYTLRKGTGTPFYIDPSTVALTAGNTYVRQATGGQPPYTYRSNLESIVQVTNGSQGEIKALAAGVALITATDSGGASGTYPVNVTAADAPTEDFESVPVPGTWPVIERPALIVRGTDIQSLGGQSMAPYITGVALVCQSTSGHLDTMTVELRQACHGFKAGVLYTTPSSSTVLINVRYTDNTQAPIAVATGSPQWLEHTAPAGKLISHLYLTPTNVGTYYTIYLDNITLIV